MRWRAGYVRQSGVLIHLFSNGGGEVWTVTNRAVIGRDANRLVSSSSMQAKRSLCAHDNEAWRSISHLLWTLHSVRTWIYSQVSTQKHSDGVVTKGWQLTTELVKDELNEGLTVKITQRRRIHGKYTWCLISGAVFWCVMRTSCPLGKDMLIVTSPTFLIITLRACNCDIDA